MTRTAIASWVTLLMILALFASTALAREIHVEVTSIAASMRDADERREDAEVELDPRLAPYSKKLRSLFAYEKYTFISRTGIAIEPGSSLPFQLPEHFSLEVAPEQFKPGGANMIEMMITLFRDVPQRSGRGGRREPDREVVLRTKIRLKNGGTVLLGGPPIRSGVLVMALSARG